MCNAHKTSANIAQSTTTQPNETQTTGLAVGCRVVCCWLNLSSTWLVRLNRSDARKILLYYCGLGHWMRVEPGPTG